jgi:hypothetical protein
VEILIGLCDVATDSSHLISRQSIEIFVVGLGCMGRCEPQQEVFVDRLQPFWRILDDGFSDKRDVVVA